MPDDRRWSRGSGPGPHTPDGFSVELTRRRGAGERPALLDSVLARNSEVLELGADVQTVHADIRGLDLGRRFDAVVLAPDLVNVPDDGMRHDVLTACARHVADDGIVLVQRQLPETFDLVSPGRLDDAATEAALKEVGLRLDRWLSATWLLARPDPALPREPVGAGPVRRQRVAAYGVVSDGRRILLTRLTALTSKPGWWTLPGGGIDHGEHPRDALVRELHEETGLPATVGELLDVSSLHFAAPSAAGLLEDHHVIRILYRVEVPLDVEPAVIEVDGTTDLAAWFGLDEAAQAPLTNLARLGVRLAGGQD